MLYSTGSKENNIRMRAKAKSQGLLLNQYGLFKKGEKINLKTEKDYYDYLGMKYLEPHER
jgi:DNA polymerase (family 10)